jgi:hypothetical protein
VSFSQTCPSWFTRVFEHLGSEQGFYTSMQLCSTFVRRSAADLQLLSVFPRLEDEGVFYASRKWLKRDASDLSHDLPPMKLQSSEIRIILLEIFAVAWPNYPSPAVLGFPSSPTAAQAVGCVSFCASFCASFPIANTSTGLPLSFNMTPLNPESPNEPHRCCLHILPFFTLGGVNTRVPLSTRLLDVAKAIRK